MNRRLSVAIAALAFSACSSGAVTPFSPQRFSVAPAAQVRLPETQHGSLHFAFRIPRRRHHRARYISPATQSFLISAQSGGVVTNAFANVTPSSPNCSGGLLELTCTTAMTLRPGPYTVTISAYDAKQSSASGTPAGHLLSDNSVAATVAAGKANALGVTLDAVPKSITVTPSSGQSNAAGNDATGLRVLGGVAVTLLAAAYDADGFLIVGPGAPPITLVAHNASGGIAVAKAANGNPNAFTLSSSSIGSAALVAAATPAGGTAVTANVPVAAVVTTAFVAGQVGTPGATNGTGTHAQFSQEAGLTYDRDDGNVYLVDPVNCFVRKITPAGVVSFVSGSTCDATGNDFFTPEGIAYDHDDGYLYIADTENCTIDRVTTSGTNFSRIAGTVGTCDSTGGDLNHPWGIVYGGNNTLFFSDQGNCEIRAIFNLDGSPSISTIAGGTGDCTNVDDPRTLAFDGTNLYFWGAPHCDIRKVGAFGEVSVLAGNGYCLELIDGTGTAAYFGEPTGMTYDSADGALYFADLTNYAIRRVTTTGVVTTIFGNPAAPGGYQEGTLTAPALTYKPWGITYASGTPGALYFVDGSYVFRKVNL